MTPKAYLDPAEVNSLEKVASNLRDRLLIRLLSHLGCRISEVVALTVPDIDLQQGTVIIQHLKTRLKLACPHCNTRLGRSHTFCPKCGAKVESAVAQAKQHRRPVDPIEEMVYALTDPIIVFPAGGWENDLPERLKNELPLRRLAHVKLCLDGTEDWDMACDLEALIYLYPASLAAPMGEQWTGIYLYLGTMCYGSTFPEDIKRETLGQHDLAQLRDLKRWIRRKKVEAGINRGKAQKEQGQKSEEVIQLAFEFTRK